MKDGIEKDAERYRFIKQHAVSLGLSLQAYFEFDGFEDSDIDEVMESFRKFLEKKKEVAK